MDWLLKIFGVSAKNRKLVKASTKALNTLGQQRKTASSSTVSDKKTSNRNLVLEIEDLPYEEYEIVGESNYQPALEQVAGPKTEKGVDHKCVVTLVCERGNKFDKNAVRVEIEGNTVGYLSRNDAEIFRDMLDEEDSRGVKVKAPARITGGWKRADSEGHYGIVLDLD
jgi:hypothetical protein